MTSASGTFLPQIEHLTTHASGSGTHSKPLNNLLALRTPLLELASNPTNPLALSNSDRLCISATICCFSLGGFRKTLVTLWYWARVHNPSSFLLVTRYPSDQRKLHAGIGRWPLAVCARLCAGERIKARRSSTPVLSAGALRSPKITTVEPLATRKPYHR